MRSAALVGALLVAVEASAASVPLDVVNPDPKGSPEVASVTEAEPYGADGAVATVTHTAMGLRLSPRRIEVLGCSAGAGAFRYAGGASALLWQRNGQAMRDSIAVAVCTLAGRPPR